MSLRAAGAALNPAVRNRILILDVERVSGITEQPWWDRRDLQKRYIHHDNVTREPRTTIVCAKFYDEAEVIRLAEWDKGGRGKFLKEVHALMSRADIIVGHNIMNADIPWLEGDLYFPRIGHKHKPNLPPLPPFKTVDTLRVARQFKSGVHFKSLNALCQILEIPAKTDVYDREAMNRAVAGSVEDQERLTEYCAGDVIATQGLFDALRPYIKNHPTLYVDGQASLTTCNRCGTETQPTPRRYIANVLSYAMRVCPNCGGYSRLSFEPERMTIVRGV
jgi:hypothetical protein